MPNIENKVNGVNTQAENIADIGGLKTAFRTYKAWSNQDNYEKDNLPGLEKYSNDQLFFMNFGFVKFFKIFFLNI